MKSSTEYLKITERYQSLLPPFLLTLFVLFLWLPVGFRVTGLAEDWSFFQLASDHVPLVPASAWNVEHVLRPFVAVPHGLGYWLTPNSFVGLNLVMMVVFVGSTLCFYALVRLLMPKEPIFAFLAAALFILYPADSITMMMRGLPIHFALFIGLLAILFLVVYWRKSRWYLLVPAWLCLVLCMGIYEQSFILALFAPLLLLVLEKRFTRKFFRAAILWYVPLLIYGAWYFIVYLETPTTYQSAQFQRGLTGGLVDVIHQFLESIWHLLHWNFSDGWTRALTSLISSPSDALIAAVTGALVIFGCYWLSKRGDKSQSGLAARDYVFIGLAGLGIMFVTYLPYTISFSYFEITERVFYYPALGAALCITALLGLIFRSFFHSPLLFNVVGSLLIVIAMGGMLVQHQYFADWSLEQQKLIRSVAEAVPGVTKDDVTVLVYLYEEPAQHSTLPGYQHPLFLANQEFETAMDYVYQNPKLHFLLCEPALIDLDEKSCEAALKTKTPDHLVFLQYHALSGKTTVLSQPPEGIELSGYDPSSVINPNAPLPYRANTMIMVCSPILTCQPPPVANVSVEFDQSEDAVGLRPSESMPDGTTFQWSTAKDMFIELPPTIPGDYAVSFRVLMGMSMGILDSLTLKANGSPIPLVWHWDKQGIRVYEGKIEHALMKSTELELHFSVNGLAIPAGGTQALGVAFDWLRLKPGS